MKKTKTKSKAADQPAADAEGYSGTYVVIGPPGTGKTTFLARQLAAILEKNAKDFVPKDTPAIVVSLTRTAAAEVVKKAGEHGLKLKREAIGTLHSHAYRAIGTPPIFDEDRIAEFNRENPAYSISFSRENIDDPDWEEASVTRGDGDELYQRYHLLRQRKIDRMIWPSDVARFASCYESFKTRNAVIDFTDMIELAIAKGGSAPHNPPYILADEAQDMSALEFSLLRMWGSYSRAMFIIGDPWQALYVWRGASPEVLQAADLAADRVKVLKQSYRVPAAAHEAAINWVRQLSDFKQIDYFPRVDPKTKKQIDGVVDTNRGTYCSPAAVVQSAIEDIERGETAMICASCSFLLDATIAELRTRAVPFSNPWRTNRGDWNPLGSFHGRSISMSRRLCEFLKFDFATWGTEARIWNRHEFAHWIDAIKTEDVLQRGAKKEMIELAKQDDAPDGPLNWATLCQEIFLPDAAFALDDFLSDCSKGAPAGGNLKALEWYAARLSAAKVKASSYPLAIARQRGTPALRDVPRIYVGTIHSFKGAEADNVYVFPELSPAGIREWERGGVHRDSVVRLFYVGMTRAKRRLVLCEADSDRAVRWRI